MECRLHSPKCEETLTFPSLRLMIPNKILPYLFWLSISSSLKEMIIATSTGGYEDLVRLYIKMILHSAWHMVGILQEVVCCYYYYELYCKRRNVEFCHLNHDCKLIINFLMCGINFQIKPNMFFIYSKIY